VAVQLPARRDLILGGFVALVAVAHALDLSFAAPFLNFLTVLFALCAGGALVLALFSMGIRRPMRNSAMDCYAGKLRMVSSRATREWTWRSTAVSFSSTASCTGNAAPISIQMARLRYRLACNLRSRAAARCFT